MISPSFSCLVLVKSLCLTVVRRGQTFDAHSGSVPGAILRVNL